MLPNAAKCQGYSFYRYWIIKGKQTGGEVNYLIHTKTHTNTHTHTKIRVNDRAMEMKTESENKNVVVGLQYQRKVQFYS